MESDECSSPFEICRERVRRIIQGLIVDADGLVCDLQQDRFEKWNFIFGVVQKAGPVVVIEYELWREIRAQEWEQSGRERPLKGDELELVLYSLAERASYTNHFGGRGWRFRERKDGRRTHDSIRWTAYEELRGNRE